MAKLDDYKNQEEIKNTKGLVRGQRIKQKDIDVLPEPVSEKSSFGKDEGLTRADGDFVELHVYDTDNHLVESVYSELDYRLENNDLVLKPGNDLRRNGFKQGKFKLVYNFFSEVLGGRLGGKVYIQEISPTRKEIRIVPVQQFPKATDKNQVGPTKNQSYKGNTAYPDVSDLEKQKTRLEERIKRIDEWEEKLLKRRRARNRLLPERDVKRREFYKEKLEKLLSRIEVLGPLHIEDRKFYREFAKFGRGIDEDTGIYAEGSVFSPNVNKKRHWLELDGNGKFDRKLHRGAKISIFNLQGEVEYQTKITRVSRNQRRIRVRDPYLVNDTITALPKRRYKIEYTINSDEGIKILRKYVQIYKNGGLMSNIKNSIFYVFIFIIII